MKYLVQSDTFTPGSWSSNQASLPLIVLPGKRHPAKRCFNWNRLLGMAVTLGVSAAGWTGVALLVSRLMK